MLPQLESDDGNDAVLGNEIEITDDINVNPSEPLVESEVDSDFDLELD